MRQLGITTEGDKIFQDTITDGGTLLEAAAKAYPEKGSLSESLDYALSKPENSNHMREGYHYALFGQGLSISKLAEEKMKTLTQAYDDPKGAKAADSIIQDIQNLFDLYPEKQVNSSLTVNNIDLSSKVEVQQAVLNQLYTDAVKNSSPEQIDNMIEADIIEDLEVLPPDQLFEKEVYNDEDQEDI